MISQNSLPQPRTIRFQKVGNRFINLHYPKTFYAGPEGAKKSSYSSTTKQLFGGCRIFLRPEWLYCYGGPVEDPYNSEIIDLQASLRYDEAVETPALRKQPRNADPLRGGRAYALCSYGVRSDISLGECGRVREYGGRLLSVLGNSGGNSTTDFYGRIFANATTGVDTVNHGVTVEPEGEVPEPATWAIMLGGLAGLLYLRHRKPAV
jgi:hypothetical protein